MKRFLCVLLLVGLTACGGAAEKINQQATKTQIVNGLTALQATINLTVQMSRTALKHEGINWREACRVDQYTRFASALVNQAFVTINQDLASAEQLLNAAKDAANGIGEQVESLVRQNCLDKTTERLGWGLA